MTGPFDALTRGDLDGETCQVPGCDHTAHDPGGLVLAPGCHPHAPLTVSYTAGVLTIRCARCTQFVTRIAVAPGPRPC